MSGKNSFRLDSTIVAALIGLCGTLTVALITLYANRPQVVTPPTSMPSLTAVPFTVVALTETATNTNTAVPSDTAAPGEPSSTPAPPTETLTPSITPIPPPAVGQDWPVGCISILWKPYPPDVPAVDNGDGCWQEPVHVFSAENGELRFASERGDGDTEIYGLFAPLPESGSVAFFVKLSELDNVDLLMGVFGAPDVVNAQGVLLVVPHERLSKLRVQQKDNVIAYNTLQSTNTFEQGNGFWVTFFITPQSASGALSSRAFLTNPVSIDSPQKWLFLGYKGLSGAYQIEGGFFALDVRR